MGLGDPGIPIFITLLFLEYYMAISRVSSGLSQEQYMTFLSLGERKLIPLGMLWGQ